MHHAAAQLVTEVPYETAESLFGDLTGLHFGSERMHTVTNQVAEGLTVLDVAPSRHSHSAPLGWRSRYFSRGIFRTHSNPRQWYVVVT